VQSVTHAFRGDQISNQQVNHYLFGEVHQERRGFVLAKPPRSLLSVSWRIGACGSDKKKAGPRCASHRNKVVHAAVSKPKATHLLPSFLPRGAEPAPRRSCITLERLVGEPPMRGCHCFQTKRFGQILAFVTRGPHKL
jgi:hypothetical protein